MIRNSQNTMELEKVKEIVKSEQLNQNSFSEK